MEVCVPAVLTALKPLLVGGWSLTTAEAAKHYNLSRSWFCCRFKKDYGVTFKAYINRERLRQICNALDRIHHRRLRSFAFERFGFSSFYHFSVWFKRHANKSPSEYLKVQGLKQKAKDAGPGRGYGLKKVKEKAEK